MATSPIRVLHVDDDPGLLELTGQFLEREDDRLVLETATSTDEGLGQLGDRPPDCIVSDYDMPGKNGIEFLQAVRETHPDLPFILFTGKGSESVASDAIAAGVTDYLQKGSGTEQYELLANRITNAVQAQRATQEATRQEELMGLTEFAGDTGGWELDLETEELTLTDGTRRLINLSQDDSLELEEAIDLYHPDDRDEVRAALDQAAETGEQVQGTWRIRPNEGEQRLLDVTVTPVRSNGDITTLRGAVNDATERYQRRQELEQIETLFQHTQGPLFLIDVGNEFTVERVNFAWEEATGIAPDLTHGKTIAELLGEKQTSAVREKYRECVRRREPLEYEERLDLGEEPTYWETRIAPVVIDGDVEYIAGSTRDVTEKRDRQRELSLLQQAIDGANVPITLADPSQTGNPLVYVNDAYEELTGYSEEEALGRNCRYLQGEDTDPGKAAALRAAIDDEEPVTVELRNYHKDGTEFWNRLTVTPIYDDDGTPVRYLGTQEDVTERKERERELESERRFIEQSLNTLEDLFYVLDTDGTIRRWNDRVPDVTGYTESELDGMDATEVFPDDEEQTIADAISRAVSGGRMTVEADLQTGNGDRIPYEWTGARLTDTDGTTTGIVGIGRDLSERRQRERRFRALVEESNDVMSIVDADGRFQYQSPSLERILGYDPEETVGDLAWEYIRPDDREAVMDTFEEWLTNPAGRESVEYRARHADGSWRWFEARASAHFDDPAVEGYVVNSRDVTARKEREQELTQTQELLSNMEELADVGAWEYAPETGVATNTAGTKRIYGVAPEADLTLDEAFEFFHPADRDRLRDRFEACLETGEPYEMDVRVVTADGDQKWVTARGERVQVTDSESVVRGYLQDVTDRKARERQLTDLNETAQRLSRARSGAEVAEIGTEVARDILGLRANALHFATEDGTELVPAAQTEESVSLIGDAPTLPVEDSIAGRVYRDSEPTAIEDVRQDPDTHDSDTNLRGHLYLPLGDHGVLVAGSAEVAAFEETDITVGELLAGNLVAALDRIDQAEIAQQRREQLSLFFEESPLGAIRWDDTFRFDHLNDRAQEILGYSEADLRGESWERIVADGDRDQVGDAVEQLLEADGGTRVVNENIRRSGEVRTCEWHNRTVTGSDGEIRSIFSKFYDVTERERRKQQLEEYETVLETLSDAVYVLDEDGQFTYINDEFVELVGYDRETIIGNTPSLIKDEEAVETAERQLGRLLSEEGPETVTFEVTIQPRDGDPIVCEDHMSVLPYEGDTFDGSVGALRDVTERKERTRELERQNDRLEEFASVVSHDLRNPLRTAVGRLELAREECDSTHLDDVAEALDRSQALIDDLLTLARGGDTVGSVEAVSVSAQIEKCWQVVPDDDATLDVQSDQIVTADRSRLQQLLENLLANAVEHGGPDVTVSVGSLANGFYVADDGAGIADEERDSVFEAGYSTAEDGTGFGLRIVKQIVDAHGWEIEVVESRSGGARFEITGADIFE